MEHYVYILVDPRGGDPFYVGKGSGDRVLAHEAEARAGIDAVIESARKHGVVVNVS